MESNFVPVPGAKVTKDYDAEAKDSRPEAQVKRTNVMDVMVIIAGVSFYML